jgi:hypothetical protein
MAGTKNTHPHPPHTRATPEHTGHPNTRATRTHGPPEEGPPAQTGRTRSLGQDAGPDASEPQQCARPPPPHPA